MTDGFLKRNTRMKMAAVLLLISGATAAHAQDDGARIRERVEKELGQAISRTRQTLRDFVLKELAEAGIGAASLAAQLERFAKTLIDDDLHNRLKKLLLSPQGKELVQEFMDSQKMQSLDSLIEAYFEKDKNGKHTVREEFEEVLAQMLDSIASPAAGSIGIDLLIDKANPDSKGLKVAGVTAGGPAATAGIKAGDILISVAGRELTSRNVEEIMKSLKPGQEVKIIYERDKVRNTVTAKAK